MRLLEAMEPEDGVEAQYKCYYILGEPERIKLLARHVDLKLSTCCEGCHAHADHGGKCPGNWVPSGDELPPVAVCPLPLV